VGDNGDFQQLWRPLSRPANDRVLPGRSSALRKYRSWPGGGSPTQGRLSPTIASGSSCANCEPISAATNALRRLQSSAGMRQYRPFADGSAKGSSRPLADLQDGPVNVREGHESGRRLAWLSAGRSERCGLEEATIGVLCARRTRIVRRPSGKSCATWRK
jgi:hypothetical protein